MDGMPIPRLCVLTKPSGGDEYGFNLHAELGRGQFVGAVDLGSAAHMADLRPGDHIVAVNGESIEGLSHKEVVQRIKSNPIRCSLLVLDEEGVLWHKERNLPFTAEHLLKRLNAALEKHEKEGAADFREEEEPIDVPMPLPRGGKKGVEVMASAGEEQRRQISPAQSSPSNFEDLAYGTEESISIALPVSSPGSPFSSPAANGEFQQQTPMPPPVQLLSAAEEEEQKKRREEPLHSQSPSPVENSPNSSPPPSPSFGKHQSPPSAAAAAIGRHAAVPVPPPAVLLANGPKPRLSTLRKANALHEFGFNLHAERGKGHFIGAVDKDGVAERAGLETGQRIVGVNGQLVFPNSPHKEIVALIKGDPLGTQLLVASEEVDRFYAEYGLAFSYDYVQVFDGQKNGGIVGRQKSSSKKPANGVVVPNYAARQPHRQNRANSSGSSSNISAEERHQQKGARNNNEYNAAGLRSRNHSLGQRPPTPTSTYSQAKERNQQQNGHQHQQNAVAVQIEQRPDNMTSIEIGELEDVPPHAHHQYIGIGTPPSSRGDDEDGTTVHQQQPPEQNGGNEAVEQKHVIAGGPVVSPPPPPLSAQPSRKSPLSIFTPSAYKQEKKMPLPLPTTRSPSSSPGSPFQKRDLGSKDIFALNANEARKAICGRKRDPRLEGQMSLEEKHRLILDL